MKATTTLTPAMKRMFHAVCGKAGMDKDMKDALLGSYGVESVDGLTREQVLEIAHKLQPDDNDKLRKRVIAAIYQYVKLKGKEPGMSEIKAIACRSAGAEGQKGFNSIPASKLRAIYSEFVKQNQAIEQTRKVINTDLKNHAAMN